ncbi:MAG: TMEM175 family protein [Bacteroidota bacterium]
MNSTHVPTSRIEAFSDGVIAIITTIMVFDLKLAESTPSELIAGELLKLLPKFLSYTFSFLTVATMWVNHHQLFHQIKQTDRRLLWYNIHLLFWMSAVPFGTHFIGTHPFDWQASFLYGAIFLMNAFSFMLMRGYVVNQNLLHETISKEAHMRIRNKNKLAMGLYGAAALLSLISVYISFAILFLVPAMYFIPEKITHITTVEE